MLEGVGGRETTVTNFGKQNIRPRSHEDMNQFLFRCLDTTILPYFSCRSTIKPNDDVESTIATQLMLLGARKLVACYK